jgi:hypothetical protein
MTQNGHRTCTRRTFIKLLYSLQRRDFGRPPDEIILSNLMSGTHRFEPSSLLYERRVGDPARTADRLSMIPRRLLTLIRAGGFGKTTLLSDRIERPGYPMHGSRSTGDNDPHRSLHTSSAVQTQHPASARHPQCASSESAAPPRLLTSLNELPVSRWTPAGARGLPCDRQHSHP